MRDMNVVETSFSLARPVTVGPCRVSEFHFKKRPTVEDNLPLAYSCALRFVQHGSVRDSEEYSDALFGLWQATKKWVPSLALQRKCTWESFAIKCMRNSIISGLRKRKNQLQTCTLNDDFPDHCEEETSIAKEMLLSLPENTSREKVVKDMMYDYYVYGKTLQEIGQKHHVTKGRVQQLLKRAIKFLQKKYSVVASGDL